MVTILEVVQAFRACRSDDHPDRLAQAHQRLWGVLEAASREAEDIHKAWGSQHGVEEGDGSPHCCRGGELPGGQVRASPTLSDCKVPGVGEL